MFMKKSRLFIVSGLAMMLGLGVAGGLAANKTAKDVKEVKAQAAGTKVYLTKESGISDDFYNYGVIAIWNHDDNTFNQFTYDSTSGYYKATLSTATDSFNIFRGNSLSWDEKWDQSDNVSFDGDKNLIVVNSWSNSSIGSYWSTYSHTVTKTAVEFSASGVATGTTWSAGSDSVISGTTYDVPDDPDQLNLEHFVGWYTNQTCTTAYTASTVTADMAIYAKYVQLSVDSYFYWTSKDSGDLTHIYFFGEYSPVSWPGTALSTYKVDEVLYYNGEAQLYKIPCPSTASFKIVLNNNGGNVQTWDIVGEAGNLLYTWYDKEYDSKYMYNGGFVDGTAADLVARVEIARNAVSASSGILDYSVCGIAPGTARNFWNEYYEMSAEDKALVDASYTYTYDGAYDGHNVPSETNIYFSDIMLSLRQVAQSAGLTVSGSLRIMILAGSDLASNNGLAIVIIASALTVSAVAGYFFLRRKKQK